MKGGMVNKGERGSQAPSPWDTSRLLRSLPGGLEGLEKPEEKSLALCWPFGQSQAQAGCWLELLLLEWALDTYHSGDLV